MLSVPSIALVIAWVAQGGPSSGTPDSASLRTVPSWAKPRDGTTYAPATGLPREVIHAGSGVEMVLVPAGSFVMGSPEDDDLADDDERPDHEVTIEEPFYLARSEITNAQFRRFRPAHDSGSYRGHTLNQDDQPVVGVSWEEARAFCQSFELRLPSEAEWEYACRSGTDSRFLWGDDPAAGQGWANAYDQKSHGLLKLSWSPVDWEDEHVVTAPVGRYRPNPLGLVDMIGNVWECCEDSWHATYEGAPEDGSAWVESSGTGSHVLRGGSWGNFARGCRPAIRHRLDADDSSYFVGFRPARSATDE